MQLRSPNDIYDVEQPTAEGGFGVVSRATRQSTGERVAIKQLKLAQSSTWGSVERFKREARILKSLEHPLIPRYIDAFSDPQSGEYYLVQEWVDAPNMLEFIESGTPLETSRIADYLRDCLDILAYLSSFTPPIIHCDLSPRNILIGPSHAYIIDFTGVVLRGEARAVDASVTGTFGYMAPEQLVGNAVPASDVYGLGVSFAQLTTRQPPSDWPTDPSSGLPSPQQPLQFASRELVDALTAMTRPSLGERVADPQRLKMMLAGGVQPNTPLAKTNPSSEDSGGQRNSSPNGIMVPALLVLLLVAGAAGFVFFSGSPASIPDPNQTSVTSTPKIAISDGVRSEPNRPPKPAPASRFEQTSIGQKLVIENDSDSTVSLRLVAENGHLKLALNGSSLPDGTRLRVHEQKSTARFGIAQLKVELDYPLGEIPISALDGVGATVDIDTTLTIILPNTKPISQQIPELPVRIGALQALSSGVKTGLLFPGEAEDEPAKAGTVALLTRSNIQFKVFGPGRRLKDIDLLAAKEHIETDRTIECKTTDGKMVTFREVDSQITLHDRRSGDIIAEKRFNAPHKCSKYEFAVGDTPGHFADPKAIEAWLTSFLD